MSGRRIRLTPVGEPVSTDRSDELKDRFHDFVSRDLMLLDPESGQAVKKILDSREWSLEDPKTVLTTYHLADQIRCRTRNMANITAEELRYVMEAASGSLRQNPDDTPKSFSWFPAMREFHRDPSEESFQAASQAYWPPRANEQAELTDCILGYPPGTLASTIGGNGFGYRTGSLVLDLLLWHTDGQIRRETDFFKHTHAGAAPTATDLDAVRIKTYFLGLDQLYRSGRMSREAKRSLKEYCSKSDRIPRLRASIELTKSTEGDNSSDTFFYGGTPGRLALKKAIDERMASPKSGPAGGSTMRSGGGV